MIESTAEVLDDMSKCLMIDEFLGNFSVRYSRRSSSPLLWAEKSAPVILNREIKGVLLAAGNSFLVFVRCAAMSKLQNVTF